MIDSVLDLDGNQWEARVRRWLGLRYPNGGFVRIPAGDSGDRGLEGYSVDGNAYQCYSPRVGSGIGKLYESQRDKLTEDVGKFIENEAQLIRIFPQNFRVQRYCFVVPTHESARLNEHVLKKQLQVRAANLPYVASDFRILILDRDDFATERAAEQQIGLERLQLEFGDVKKEQLARWAAGNDRGVHNLERKIRIYSGSQAPEEVEWLRDKWIESYIQTQNALDRLRKKSVAVWEQLDASMRARERLLFRHYSQTAEHAKVLNEQVTELVHDMTQRVPNLERTGAETLAQGIIGGWLQDCALNFPGQRHVLAHA